MFDRISLICQLFTHIIRYFCIFEKVKKISLFDPDPNLKTKLCEQNSSGLKIDTPKWLTNEIFAKLFFYHIHKYCVKIYIIMKRIKKKKMIRQILHFAFCKYRLLTNHPDIIIPIFLNTAFNVIIFLLLFCQQFIVYLYAKEKVACHLQLCILAVDWFTTNNFFLNCESNTITLYNS